uniref:Putative secreted protein n=1 Tax=Anopheles marajoara TaxID=58244 RepID=A0A2M4C9H2_9DIPT
MKGLFTFGFIYLPASSSPTHLKQRMMCRVVGVADTLQYTGGGAAGSLVRLLPIPRADGTTFPFHTPSSPVIFRGIYLSSMIFWLLLQQTMGL